MNRLLLNLQTLTLLVLLTMPVGVQAATAGRDYGQSVKALQQEKWDRAEKAIRSALEKEASAQESMLISGGVRYRYIPYYVLGAALYGQGDCQGASEAWNESLSQGEVQNTENEFGALKAGMADCGASLASATEPAAESTETPAEEVAETQPAGVSSEEFNRLAEANARSLEELKQANTQFETFANNTDLDPEWNKDWKPALDQSKSELRRLEILLQKEAQSFSPSSTTEKLETIASHTLAAINAIGRKRVAAEQRIDVLSQQRLAQNSARDEELNRLAAEEEQRRQTALREQREAEERRLAVQREEEVGAAQQVLQQELDRVASSIRESGGDARVDQSRAALASLVAASEAMLNSDSVEDVTDQTQILRDGLRSYSQTFQEWEGAQRDLVLRTPPDELRNIADAYFEGNYSDVLQLVAAAEFSDTRHRVQARLFRSAAQFNTYWLTGADNDGLLERSRQDIIEIKRLDSEFMPYVAAFSPRFMDFFRDL